MSTGIKADFNHLMADVKVREFQSPLQLGLHDADFGGQIFVPRPAAPGPPSP